MTTCGANGDAVRWDRVDAGDRVATLQNCKRPTIVFCFFLFFVLIFENIKRRLDVKKRKRTDRRR